MLDKLLDGRYRVLQVLSAGGFGRTYIAEDNHRPGNPKCVVKQLVPASSEPNYLQTARRLFNSEAETLEQLGNHDQIPRLLAYFEENQEFFLVQEFIVGHPLTVELHPNQPWTESQVIQLLQDVLGILAFVHNYGVIHRDIKPDNLIRRISDRKLVLIDFGAVKQVQTQIAISPDQMKNSVIVGTPGYMPSEQGLGRPRLSSDIYALGIIAIQALTGLYPNQLPTDATTGEILWQHRVQVSPGLAAILTQMVRYDYRERYQSASKVLQAIEQLSNALPPTVLPSTPPLPVTPTQALPVLPHQQNTPSVAATSNKLPLIIAAIAVGVGIGVAVAYVKSASRPSPVSKKPNVSPVTPSPQTSSSPNLGVIPSGTDSTPQVTSSPSNTTPVASPNEFDTAQFPQPTCGDSRPSDTASPTAFYPVFIDYSDSILQGVTSNFCADAYRTNRKDTGKVAIQVASFSNRSRAELFSDFMQRKLGSGGVGPPTLYSANSNPKTPSQNNCSTVVSDPDSALNVRSQPDTTSNNIVGTLANGIPLTVTAERDGWLQISSPALGWVSKSYTKTVCQ